MATSGTLAASAQFAWKIRFAEWPPCSSDGNHVAKMSVLLIYFATLKDIFLFYVKMRNAQVNAFPQEKFRSEDRIHEQA